jgi:hypothetical protein
MSRQVKILRAGTSLPDGNVYYTVGSTVTLTDSQFARVGAGSFSAGWIEDLGAPPSDTVITLPQGTSAAAGDLLVVTDDAPFTTGLVDPGLVVGARAFLGSAFGFFGDSITNYGEGYPYYAAMRSRGAIRPAHVKANPGDSSTVLLPKLAAQILAATPKPTACVLLCGANDAIASAPLATYKANVIAMVGQLRAAGIAPVLCTVPPNNSDTAHGFVRIYNAWLARYAELQRIPLVDFYGLLLDQTTGDYKTAYNGGDGVHPSVAANDAMGQLVYDTLAGFLTPRPYLVQPYAGAPNLMANSNFLVDSNADGLADGLSTTLSAGYTVSLVADPAGFKWQRMTLSGKVVHGWQIGSGAVTVSGGAVAVGDRLRFSARVRTGQADTSGITAAGSTLQLTCYRAGYAAVTLNTILTSPQGAMSRQIDGIVSAEIVVPALTEIILWTHQVGPANGTYDVAQPTLLNLTALGAE